MLWTIAVVLLILWLLGFISHVGGSLVHLLLVIALVVVLIRVIQGRRVSLGEARQRTGPQETALPSQRDLEC